MMSRFNSRTPLSERDVLLRMHGTSVVDFGREAGAEVARFPSGIQIPPDPILLMALIPLRFLRIRRECPVSAWRPGSLPGASGRFRIS